MSGFDDRFAQCAFGFALQVSTDEQQAYSAFAVLVALAKALKITAERAENDEPVEAEQIREILEITFGLGERGDEVIDNFADGATDCSGLLKFIQQTQPAEGAGDGDADGELPDQQPTLH